MNKIREGLEKLSAAATIFKAEKLQHNVSNAFCFNFAKEFFTDECSESNQVFQPLSLSMTLAMLLTGSGGDIQEEIKTSLDIAPDQNKKAVVKQLLEFVQVVASRRDNTKEFDCVQWKKDSQVFFEYGWKSSRPFWNYLNKNFKTEINDETYITTDPVWKRNHATLVEFMTDVEVAKASDEEPSDPVFEPKLKGALLDFTYVCVEKAWQCGKDSCVEGEFSLIDGRKVEANYMHGKIKGFFADFSDWNCKCFKFYLKKSKFAFIIILPNEVDGIAEVTKKLLEQSTVNGDGACKSEVNFMKTINEEKDYQNVIAETWIPKFSAMKDVNVKTPLQRMGFSKLFKASGGFKPIVKDMDMYVGDVLHNSYIKIDNQHSGDVELPAEMGLDEVSFKVDHPFIFAIIGPDCSTITHFGRIFNPTV